jgi:hypothetical protein
MGCFIAYGTAVLILKLMGGAITIQWKLVIACYLFEPIFLLWIYFFNKVVGAFLDWMDGVTDDDMPPEEVKENKYKEKEKTVEEEEIDANFQEMAA